MVLLDIETATEQAVELILTGSLQLLSLHVAEKVGEERNYAISRGIDFKTKTFQILAHYSRMQEDELDEDGNFLLDSNCWNFKYKHGDYYLNAQWDDRGILLKDIEFKTNIPLTLHNINLVFANCLQSIH